MHLSRSIRAIALAAATVLASTTLMANANASTSVIPGKFDYFWTVDRNISKGILTDSAAFQFSGVKATYKYDVSTIPAHDIATFALTAKKISSGAKIDLSFAMLTAVAVNGHALDIRDFMGARNFHYTKAAGDTRVSVTIVSQSATFNSAAAQAGRFGAVKIVPTITVQHMIPIENSDPVEYMEGALDAPIEVNVSTPGVTGLSTIFQMRHNGKTVKLPSNVVSSSADVEWNASSTIAKSTTVKASKLTGKVKLPSAKSPVKLALTWCSSANNQCKRVAANKNKAYYSLSASNKSGNAYVDSTNSSTIKLPWATKKVYASQGFVVNSHTVAGTVLTMSSIKVTR